MSKQITIIILFMALAACSNKKSDVIGVEVDGEYYAVDHAAKEAAVNNDGKDKLICTHRQQTGSHFKQKRCTTVSQRNKDRKDAKEILDDQQIRQNRTYSDSKKN